MLIHTTPPQLEIDPRSPLVLRRRWLKNWQRSQKVSSCLCLGLAFVFASAFAFAFAFAFVLPLPLLMHERTDERTIEFSNEFWIPSPSPNLLSSFSLPYRYASMHNTRPYMHIMHARVCMCMIAGVCVCVHVYVRSHMYMSMCISAFIYMYVWICFSYSRCPTLLRCFWILRVYLKMITIFNAFYD